MNYASTQKSFTKFKQYDHENCKGVLTAEFSSFRYRCTPDNYHFKKVRIFCADDGSISEYKVKVIKSCRCKKFTNQQNMILTPSDRKKSSSDEKHTVAESDDDGDEEPVTEEQ